LEQLFLQVLLFLLVKVVELVSGVSLVKLDLLAWLEGIDTRLQNRLHLFKLLVNFFLPMTDDSLLPLLVVLVSQVD